MLLPGLDTERLLLRPRTMADFAACLAMDREPGITRFVQGPWDDPERHAAFLRNRIAASFGDGLGYWSIFPRTHPDRFSGWILLIPADGVGPEIEIGWRLNRSAQGRGYATEAARAVLEHAFETAGLDRVVADIHPDNHASIRVARKIGMVCEADGMHGTDPYRRHALSRAGWLAARQDV